ncbi:hypothetical protein ACFFMM_24010 [Micromonospora chaiyaphumensis]|uniref:D-mannose binding lectin n=1 Tax=Micromonospora chaiyaphumensis TaxID=307119 RepID=A0A1C4UTV6_9ACTN|nr:hypothetical protein [Micromonospora chaiyaphumensis]SCE75025.1 D-mannose binding lectin [Micromonospora chaiyaphumensis]
MARPLLGAVVAVGIVLVSALPAQAANLGYAIFRGHYINKGDYLTRTVDPTVGTGYSVQLIMQPDGNLVLKRTTGKVCWAAGTNPSGHHAVYQQDGNFVVVNSSGRALWASNTVGSISATGSTVAVENTGSFFVGKKLIFYRC